MTINIVIIARCNHVGCTKSMKVEASNATRRHLYKACIGAGWVWKNAKTQFCSTHKPSMANAKAKKSVKPVAKKTAAPRVRKPVAKKVVAIKPADASEPKSIWDNNLPDPLPAED